MLSLIIRRALLQDVARSWRVVFAIALGAAVTSSVLGVSISIGDQVEREFRAFGANIELVGTGAHAGRQHTVTLGGVQYAQSDLAPEVPVGQLPALRTIFWRSNILGFTPFLQSTVELRGKPVLIVGTWFHKRFRLPNGNSETTGVPSVEPWWHVEGNWPEDESADACLVGQDLAKTFNIKVGDTLPLKVFGADRSLRVVGIVRTGGAEEDEIVAPLGVVERWTGHTGLAQRVEISANIKPDDALAHKDPAQLSEAEREKLTCSPYMGVVISEIKSVVPGMDARPIRRIADSEGKMLDRIQLLMNFVLLAAVLASLLGAGSATAAAAIQRRSQMGLVKALGATRGALLVQLGLEALVLGLIGGLIGTAAGIVMQEWIGRVVFGSTGPVPWMVAPVGLGLAVLIAVASSIAPLWSAIEVDPVQVLRGE